MKRVRWIVLLLMLLLLPIGAFAEAYTVPEAKASREAALHDGDERTFLTASSPDGFTLRELSADVQGVLLAWYNVPERYEVQFLNESGKVVRTEWMLSNALHQYLPTNGAAAVRVSGSRLELAEFVPVTDPASLSFVPNDTPCDALLLLSHIGDESLVAAPVLKLLSDHGLTIQIVYLYEDARDRMGEAIETLHAYGILRDPLFFNWTAPAEDTKESAMRVYQPKEAKAEIQALWQTYRPRIWITDGIGAGGVLSGRLPEITEQVEKHYLLSESGSIEYALSAEEAAICQSAYELQASQRLFRFRAAETCRLTLLSEGAPEQVLDGYLPESFLTYATPTPIPTATPAPTPTEAPTTAPESIGTPKPDFEDAAAEPDAEPEESQSSGAGAWIWKACGGLSAVVLLLLAIRPWKKEN